MKLADGTGTSGSIKSYQYAKNGGEPENQYVEKPSMYGYSGGHTYNSSYNNSGYYNNSYEDSYNSYSGSAYQSYSGKAKPKASIFGGGSSIFSKKESQNKGDGSKSKSKSKKKLWSKSNSKSKKSRSKSKSKWFYQHDLAQLTYH